MAVSLCPRMALEVSTDMADHTPLTCGGPVARPAMWKARALYSLSAVHELFCNAVHCLLHGAAALMICMLSTHIFVMMMNLR